MEQTPQHREKLSEEQDQHVEYQILKS